MLERLTRRTVLDFEPYEWEPSSAVIAERHGLAPRDVIRFDLNTSPFVPASWDASVEVARLERLPNEYFDPAYLELADLISAYCDVSPANLVIGTGADEILDIVVKTFLDNGDAAVIAPPTYSFHAIVTGQIGGVVRYVPLLAPDFALDVPGVLAAAQGAKLIWVCNPNSPTGNAFPPEALRELLEAAPCFVVIDEAYAEFAGWSAIPLVAQYPHLIVVRTMSKAFGLAGMRLGWAVGQEPVAAMLNRVRPPNSINIVTARVAAAALRDTAAMRAQVAAIVAEREPFAAALRDLGAHVYPSVTNFLLTGWGDAATAQGVYDWLEARGMVVRNFSHHRLIPGHLRITVRAPEENARLIAALAEWRAAR